MCGAATKMPVFIRFCRPTATKAARTGQETNIGDSLLNYAANAQPQTDSCGNRPLSQLSKLSLDCVSKFQGDISWSRQN
jgi:hypothetical protein